MKKQDVVVVPRKVVVKVCSRATDDPSCPCWGRPEPIVSEWGGEFKTLTFSCKGHVVPGKYREEIPAGRRPVLDEVTIKEWDSVLDDEFPSLESDGDPVAEIPPVMWGVETPEEVYLLESSLGLGGTSDSVQSSTIQEMVRIIEERDNRIAQLQSQVLYWRKRASPRALVDDDSVESVAGE